MRSTSAAAASPPILREVFEEGLFIPVLKLYDAGAPVEPVFEFLRANVRTPEEVLGDVHSQVVGNQVGGRQLLSFLEEFDLADIEALSDVIVERTERAMRERIAALPDGDYGYGCEIDGFDAPVRIEVTVRVRGDELTSTTPARRRPSATASTSRSTTRPATRPTA